MKSRIVTVTLAVALALWSNAAWSQTEAPLPDPLTPLPIFDDPLQSGLPLGEFGAAVEKTSARAPAPDPVRVERVDEWMYTLRHSVRSAPRKKIALGAGGLCMLSVFAWAGLAARKRSKRAYRRMPRSSGGSRVNGLAEVVASVQEAQSRNRGAQARLDRFPGSEWPR